MRNQSQVASISTEALLEQYASNPTKELRERLVEAHLYIAQIIARKFSGRGVDYDDLYQVAALALFKAVDRFDATKGIKFVSFVTPTMVGEVKNYFRDYSRTIRLPRRGAQLLTLIRAACTELEQALGRAPRVDELSAHLGIDESDVLEGLEMGGAASPASLDQQIASDDESASLGKFLGIEEAGYSDFEMDDMLSRAMEFLDARQRDVVQKRFFENRSQRDVADELQVSQMTVSRVERQALAILREKIQPDGDQ